MITIRLSRIGKRHQPIYRFVVQDKTTDPWSPALEILGNYNPRAKENEVTLKKDRVEYWLSQGAQPSETVHNILVDQGILKGDKKRKMSITKKRATKIADAKAAEEEAKKKAEEEAKAKAEAEKAAAEQAAAEAAAPAESPAEAPAEEKAE